MPRIGFEPTILAFKRAKRVHDLDREDTVIGFFLSYFYIYTRNIHSDVCIWVPLSAKELLQCFICLLASHVITLTVPQTRGERGQYNVSDTVSLS
jgi:hypothetical protein